MMGPPGQFTYTFYVASTSRKYPDPAVLPYCTYGTEQFYSTVRTLDYSATVRTVVLVKDGRRNSTT